MCMRVRMASVTSVPWKKDEALDLRLATLVGALKLLVDKV